MQNNNIKDNIETVSLKQFALIFGKTIFSCIVAIFLFVAVSTVVLPSTAIKMFDTLGMKNASYSVYETKYLRTNECTDLYNLIEKSIQEKKYKKTIKYIDEFKKKDEYSDFLKNIDKEALKKTDIKYAYLVYSYDQYLNNQLVLCNYRIGKVDKAFELALNTFDEENELGFEFGVYVDCILSDKNLSKTEKSEKLTALSTYEYGKTTTIELMVLLDGKYESVKEGANTMGDDYKSAIYLETAYQIARTQKEIALAKNDEAGVDLYQSRLDTLNSLILALIESEE